MDQILAGDDHCMEPGANRLPAFGNSSCVLPALGVQTQLSIWSIMAAPLIMSNDPATLNQTYKDILLNKEMIRVNQDPLGRPGFRVSPPGTPEGGHEALAEVWARSVTFHS